MTKRTIVLAAILLVSISLPAWYVFEAGKTPKKAHTGAVNNKIADRLLTSKAASLKKYAADNGYNTNISFMIDMNLAPGKKRFFVYNLAKDSVLHAGLVAHGSGSEGDNGPLKFSNTPGSLATSLGRYKISHSYYGQFGLAFKLHGLDKTNSKAFERLVVLHAHECVPEGEVYPLPICLSWGCPTVAPSFLQILKKYISQSEKPVLLQIYYGK